MKTPNADDVEQFRDARAKYEEAARNYRDAFRKAFSVGCTVTSIKHGRVQCEILGHGPLDEAIVQSETGKKYRIGAYWIIGAFKPETT